MVWPRPVGRKYCGAATAAEANTATEKTREN